MKIGYRLFASMLLLSLSLTSWAQAIHFQSVSWTPEKIASGAPLLFKVETSGPVVSLQSKWQGHDLVFFSTTNSRVWYGLAGVDVEAKPGSYPLAVEATLKDGSTIRDERTVSVAPATYKTETLRVPSRYVEPDPETLRRIEADKAIKTAAFARQVAEAEWSGKFVAPVDSTASEGFGTRRTFNGKLASIHKGMDYHAKSGTPVSAANSGEVVLAHELFYEGNCVIINHGQQFLTLYMHLSKLEVAEGDKVKKGQEIGLSGATGRATGPHLHMAARWQGAYVDPAQLLALPLPTLP